MLDCSIANFTVFGEITQDCKDFTRLHTITHNYTDLPSDYTEL